VRLVTRVAKHSLRVRDGIDLGKPFRLGGVFFVAPPAEIGDVGKLGDVAAFSLHMFGLRAMAGFASYTRMFARLMGLGFGIVAEGALVVPSIGNRRCGNHVQRTRPVVPIFAKVFGDHGGANDEEDNQSSQKDQRGTNQVSRIPEKATQSHPQNLKRNSCPHEREAQSLRRQVCGSRGNIGTKRKACVHDY
jgi:hypothetical protein